MCIPVRTSRSHHVMSKTDQIRTVIGNAFEVFQQVCLPYKGLYSIITIVTSTLVSHPHTHQVELDHTFGSQLLLGADVFLVIDICHKAQQVADLAGGHFFGLAHQAAHNTLGFVYIIFRHLFRRDLRRQLILLSIAATAVIAAGTAAVSAVAVVISAPVVVIATAAIAVAIIIPSCHLCRHPFCSDRHKYKLR